MANLISAVNSDGNYHRRSVRRRRREQDGTMFSGWVPLLGIRIYIYSGQ